MITSWVALLRAMAQARTAIRGIVLLMRFWHVLGWRL